MEKTKILTVFGTRPEVIKLAPIIQAAKDSPDFNVVTCATTQQRELQNDVLTLCGINPHYDLDVMVNGQDLYHVTESVLTKMKSVLDQEKPDYTLVQGDTTTAFSAALASFYQKIPVVHIEAGLRTGNIYSPFPEEANRCLISRIATFHMAPTQQAVKNLANEGLINNVYHVGNTIVDAVDWILSQNKEKTLCEKKEKVLVTVHRRENFGEPLKNICHAIKSLADEYPNHLFVWPVHPNPNVKNYIEKEMSVFENVHLVEPMSYESLIGELNECSLVLSDSGGIQEESCILNKSILILREETERPEVVAGGFGVLVGSDTQKIIQNFRSIINQKNHRSQNSSPYGNPGVSNRILSILHSNTRHLTKKR